MGWKLIRVFVLSLFLLVSVLPQTPTVKAQEPIHLLEVRTDKPVYYEKGETIQIEAFSNSAIPVTLNVFWNWRSFTENELIYQNTKTANATWDIPTANAKVGFYKIMANTSETTVTIWKTLIHFTNYISESLPFSHTWKGINYSLIGRNFRAEKEDDFIEITYPKIPFAHETYLYRNNMSFLVRLDAVSWNVDLCYMTVHNGLKWIVNGTLNNPQTFNFQCVHNPLKQWKKKLDSYRSERNLVFDWSDFRKAGKAFTWNQTSKTLSVTIPSTFSLDPAIFEDGFESGDTSEWTGTSAGSGCIINASEYTERTGDWGGYAYCNSFQSDARVYQTISGESTVYLRGYIQFKSWGLASGYRCEYFGIRALASARQTVGIINDGGTHKWYLSAYNNLQTILNASYPVVDTWYCVELKATKGTGNNAEARFYLNGVERLNFTNGNVQWDLTHINFGYRVPAGGHSSSSSCWLDDAIIDTSYIGCEVEGQDLTFSLFENFNIWSSITKALELSNSLFENVNSWSSLTMNKAKGFSLFENILVYSSVSRGIELASILFENPQIWSSITETIELSVLDLTFILFENPLLYPSLSRGIEISRSLSGIVNVWSSLATATEGIAQDLTFVLFESVGSIAVLISSVAEAYVLGDALALGAIAFVLAIVAICLLFAFQKKS